MKTPVRCEGSMMTINDAASDRRAGIIESLAAL